MTKRLVIVLMMCFVVTALALGQTPSSSVWPLTSDQSSVVTGNLTATSQALSNMQISYSNSVQRSSPSGTAGSWPGEAVENGTRYMQFTVSPKANFDFTVTSVSLFLYVNSGSGMKANVYNSMDSTFATKTQIGTTLTLGTSAPSSPNVSVSPNLVVSAGKTFYLRVYPWYTSATTGKYVITNSVTIAGTTLNATAPLIVVAASDLPKFGAIAVGKSSLVAGYSVSGLNLVADLVVTAPAGFEVSKDSTTFASSVSLTPSGGAVSTTTIYARFSPPSATGTVSDGIINSSLGATSKIVNVEGIAIAQEPTTQSMISFGTVAGNSIVVNFSGGNGSRRIFVARADSAVSWLPTDGNKVSGVSSDFSAATNQGNGNKVVYDSGGSFVVMTGLSVNTMYYVSLFEYNIGTNNSQNYNTSSPGTGNTTTLSVATLSVNPSSLSFGLVIVNTSSVEKSYSLSGKYLTPGNGNITVATPAGFQISKTSGSQYTSSLQVPYTNGEFSDTIYVKFAPTVNQSYSDTIAISGGGAVTLNVAVSGKGVSQAVKPGPSGFASCGSGTTGGAGGDTVVVTGAQQLADIMMPREKNVTTPLVVIISGTLSGYPDEVEIKRTANVSVLGRGADAKLLGFGFKIVDSQNIIVRNITFADCTAGEGDAISIEGCTNVWIDHCSFTDSPGGALDQSHDGQTDIKKGSYNVTVSWNHYMNHMKTCLLGHSTSETGDTVMKVSYIHNWFDGTYSRQPRVRYCKAHVLNNLYTNVGAGGGYGVGSTCEAQVFVEGNYFENTATPTLISLVNDTIGTLSGDPKGYLKASNNYLSNSGSIVENSVGFNFNPTDYYSYTADDAQSVKDTVKKWAGVERADSTITVGVLPAGESPMTFELHQNYPNPFNPTTLIHFALPTTSRVSLIVYSLLGQVVATLVDGTRPAGSYAVHFSARSGMASGLYLYRLEAGSFVAVKKMLILK